MVKSGDEVTLTQHDHTLMTWSGEGANARLFVPWNPAKPEKAYVWTDAAGPNTWVLPPTWPSADRVWLYRLTDRGRTAEMAVPVTDDRITLTVSAKTPYVVYPSQAPARSPLRWGEGGPVEDPGFDSYGFTAWQPTGPARIEADGKGNPRLILPGDATAVSQAVSALAPGRSYAATVWTQTTDGRTAGLEIHCGGTAYTNQVTLCNVRHSAPNDPRTGTKYQRLRVVFTPSDRATILTLRATPGAADALVEFDDIRVVETQISPNAARHDFWEDFESVETGGYGPFSGCPGERTHLSEANPPYTMDTINGRFSLKSRDSGRVLRTLPSALRLKPATTYRLTCQTLGQGRLTAISKGRTVMELTFPNLADNRPAAISGEFTTREDPESYLALFRDGGDFIAIDDLAIDELGPATEAELAIAIDLPVIADDKLAGHRVLLEDLFAKPLGDPWTPMPSTHPGTSIAVRQGALVIDAFAHISILAERTLPPGVAAVETHLTVDDDAGQTWGPGLALVWPGGQQLRINLRSPDGRFGVDSTAAGQIITGALRGDAAALRIRFDDQSVTTEARCAGDPNWQQLATFPRTEFPGAPATVRLGKTHAVEGLDDHNDLGPIGTTTFSLLRLYRRN